MHISLPSLQENGIDCTAVKSTSTVNHNDRTPTAHLKGYILTQISISSLLWGYFVILRTLLHKYDNEYLPCSPEKYYDDQK